MRVTKEIVNLNLDLSSAGGGGCNGVIDRYFLWILVDAKGVEAGSSGIRVSRVSPVINGGWRSGALESRINLMSIKHSMKNQRDKLKMYQRKVCRYGWPSNGYGD